MASEGTIQPRCLLYDTTFTLHRLSPLYTSRDVHLDNLALSQHARRFRDIIVGDVLRGVQVGLESEGSALQRTGALQNVTWRLLSHEELWNPQDETQIAHGEEDTTTLGASSGMLMKITYERTAYTAILLRDIQREIEDGSITGMDLDGDESIYFPLLLTKMPGPLRDTFADFLTTTFDTRISVLRLPRTYTTTAFERYVAYVCIREDGDLMDYTESSGALNRVVGSVVVSIGFDLPDGSSTLKTIDIKIAKPDLPGIMLRGNSLGGGADKSPFVNALTTYVKARMALDLAHERVKVMAIACEAFSLGAEGKVKLTSPWVDNDGESPGKRSTIRLLNSLVVFAKGGTLSEGYDGP
ncbi:uncharacterized protein BP5553_04242 [Venustampulla echinocandica]|uniref:Uncharacterized protein n=1 Tax=Venustampulla echinocandica TaxID=2656787 RepID=A0A370TWJ7_9HELO|nr:uncharacterized protein BP5553_04242 [Venustampulla echinocandica]RDL39902.1 hypothetical protein BP5553_04242 [Venustampulla echinocandica]